MPGLRLWESGGHSGARRRQLWGMVGGRGLAKGGQKKPQPQELA